MGDQRSSATKTWTSDWRCKPFSTVNSSCPFAANLSTANTKFYAVAEIRQCCNWNKVHACNFQRFFELSRAGDWICKRRQRWPFVFKTKDQFEDFEEVRCQDWKFSWSKFLNNFLFRRPIHLNLKHFTFAIPLRPSDNHFKTDTIIRGVWNMYGRFKSRSNE